VAKSLIRSTEKTLHKLSVDITETPRYSRGRPKNGETRQPTHMEYDLNITIEEDPEKTEKLRLEAGCFVLITNVLHDGY
jgi:hypothetical protein